MLENLDVARAEGYLRRGDFSRWIADVLGDHALARELQAHEREYVQSRSGDALRRIAPPSGRGMNSQRSRKESSNRRRAA